MVCLGNICRSPLAEGLLRKTALEKGISIEIDSAGLESIHVGEAPDPRTQRNARTHGLEISNLRARQFRVIDFDVYDKIFVMDLHIFKEVISMARNEMDEAKVKMILDVIYPNENRPVPDPYLGGESGFEEVFQLLENACIKITSLLLKNQL